MPHNQTSTCRGEVTVTNICKCQDVRQSTVAQSTGQHRFTCAWYLDHRPQYSGGPGPVPALPKFHVSRPGAVLALGRGGCRNQFQAEESGRSQFRVYYEAAVRWSANIFKGGANIFYVELAVCERLVPCQQPGSARSRVVTCFVSTEQ